MAEKKNLTKNTPNEDKALGEEKQQFRLFRKKRAGIVLTKDQVKEIKAGRKKLREEMKARGIKSRKEFEITASAVGLYFDKNKGFSLLWWFLWGKGLWLLLGLGTLLLLLLFGMSAITELRGHFTITLGDDLFREGFTISETKDFRNPTSHLFSTPAENVPCITMLDIPKDVDSFDGQHNGNYFAYTFYIRNEGDKTASYTWELLLNSESQNLSDAAWVMVFEDGAMSFYAKKTEDGQRQTVPAEGSELAYPEAPFREVAKDPLNQYEILSESAAQTLWRLHALPFETQSVVTSGLMTDVEPMEVHKYTVVIWLEGNDPDCTNDKIGGHLGLELRMELVED